MCPIDNELMPMEPHPVDLDKDRMTPREILDAIYDLELFVHTKIKPSSPLFKMAIIRLHKLNTLFFKTVRIGDGS